MRLDETQTPLIRKLKNAKDIWETLKEFHQKSTLSNKVSYLKKLCRAKLKDGVSMEAHLFSFDLQFEFILSSLPDSYDVLVTALEARPEKDLTLSIDQIESSINFLQVLS
jgi:hypothetical protein